MTLVIYQLARAFMAWQVRMQQGMSTNCRSESQLCSGLGYFGPRCCQPAICVCSRWVLLAKLPHSGLHCLGLHFSESSGSIRYVRPGASCTAPWAQVRADPKLAAELEAAEAARLEAARSAMSPEELEAAVRETEELRRRQARSGLPRHHRNVE